MSIEDGGKRCMRAFALVNLNWQYQPTGGGYYFHVEATPMLQRAHTRVEAIVTGAARRGAVVQMPLLACNEIIIVLWPCHK